MQLSTVFKGTFADAYSLTGALSLLTYTVIYIVESVAESSFSLKVNEWVSDTTNAQILVKEILDTGPLALDLNAGILAVLFLAHYVLYAAVAIGALRSYNTGFDETQLTNNVLWPTINVLVGSIGFGLLLAALVATVVFPALISPWLLLVTMPVGIGVYAYLTVRLYTWQVYIAVHNDNILGAITNAWEETHNHVLEALGSVIVMHIVIVVVTAIIGLLTLLDSPPVTVLVKALSSALATTILLSFSIQLHRGIAANTPQSS